MLVFWGRAEGRFEVPCATDFCISTLKARLPSRLSRRFRPDCLAALPGQNVRLNHVVVMQRIRTTGIALEEKLTAAQNAGQLREFNKEVPAAPHGGTARRQ